MSSSLSVASVVEVLGNTFNPNTTLRESAESQLSQLERTLGYYSILLQINTVPEIHFQIKQAAILRLKNTIKTHWDLVKTDSGCISEPDRVVIRENIVEAIVWQPEPLIRVQLLECVLMIAKIDFPEKWAHQLIPALMANITNTSQPQRVYAGVCILFKLFKRYQWVELKRRGPLYELVKTFFPILHELFTKVIDMESNEAWEIQRQIIKIFFLSVQLSIPPYLRAQPEAEPTKKSVKGKKGKAKAAAAASSSSSSSTPDPFLAWLSLIVRVLSKTLPTPAAGSPPLTKNHPLWKCKKWAALICCRIFARFGRPSKVKEETLKPFAKQFQTVVAPQLIELFCQMLAAKKNGMFVTSRVHQLAISYLDTAITVPAFYKLIKTKLQFIICDVVMPCLCLTAEDIELLRSDPQEFVRRQLDVIGAFEDPRNTARDLVKSLMALDQAVDNKDTFTMCLQMIAQVFNQYAQSDAAARDYIAKEGAMQLFGVLKSALMRDEESRRTTEQIFLAHILPELTSPHAFLRSRGFILVGRFSKLKWTDDKHHEQIISLLCGSLQDSELSVRLEACTAVSKILKHDKSVELLVPRLPLILEVYFQLIDEVGNEEIIERLAVAIERFGVEMAPFAMRIVTRFAEMFMEFSQADQSDDEAALNAMQSLRGINTLLYAIEDLPELVPAIEQVLTPLLNDAVHPKAAEFFEEVLNIINILLYLNPNPISPFMWSLLPRIIDAYETYATDYLACLVRPIDNYLSKGTQHFISCKQPNYLQLVLNIIERPLASQSEGSDSSYACKLLEAIFAHSRGLGSADVDRLMPDTIKLCGQLLISLQSQQTAREEQREKEKKEAERLAALKKKKKKGKKKEKDLEELELEEDLEALRNEDITLQLRLLLIDVIAVAAYYNPTHFCITLSQCPVEFTQSLFNHWFSHIPSMDESLRHEKLTVIGLSSLALIPLSTLPEKIRASFHHVLNESVKTLTLMMEQYERVKVAEQEEEENGDGEEDGEEEDVDDEDDEDFQARFIDEGDDDPLNHEEEEEEEEAEDQDHDGDAAAGAGSVFADADDAEEESTMSKRMADFLTNYDQAEVDEIYMESPIDDIDEFIFFSTAFQEFAAREPAWYAEWHSIVLADPKLAPQVQQVIIRAQQRKGEIENEKKEAEEEKNKKAEEKRARLATLAAASNATSSNHQ